MVLLGELICSICQVVELKINWCISSALSLRPLPLQSPVHVRSSEVNDECTELIEQWLPRSPEQTRYLVLESTCKTEIRREKDS